MKSIGAAIANLVEIKPGLLKMAARPRHFFLQPIRLCFKIGPNIQAVSSLNLTGCEEGPNFFSAFSANSAVNVLWDKRNAG
jgi:hypothetical protein